MLGDPPQAIPLLRRELSAGTLRGVRVAVLLSALGLLPALVRWQLHWIDARHAFADSFPEYAGSLPLQLAVNGSILLAFVAVAVWWLLAALLFLRRSRDLLGNLLTISFFCFGGIVIDSSRFTSIARADDLPFIAPALMLANAPTMPWMFVFPSGRLSPRWAIVPIAVWVGWYALRAITPAADPSGLLNFVWYIPPVMGAASIIGRGIRSADPVERTQLRWLALAGLFFLIPWVILNLTKDFGLSDASPLYFSTATSALAAVAEVAVPLALAAAIFREGLLDIDLVLNRTITYGALTAILVGGFVLLSSIVQRILVAATGGSSDLALVIAAVPLALVFLPLRSALLRFAARFISGKRVLTILFVDIAGSTELAVRIGDRAWRETLERFRAVVRPQLKRYGGEEIDTAGDSFFVTFDGPGRAVRCARAIVDATHRIGIAVRAGLHVGEVEVYSEGVSGVAVHYATRLMTLARPGEVVVSQPLRELVAGSNIAVQDRGEHELKGIPGTARVFTVASA